ncbi:hypothetical protein ABWK22_01725 [Gottfriedia acidiceleris]|uniref:hypothetical protein n=1 Tax=Gottfriedia acidiceleris TaxID=371036 RepID=UPI00339B6C97
MKPTLHGFDEVCDVIVTRIPSEKINVNALIDTFHNNLDKVTPSDWIERYGKISTVYKTLFTNGELPEEMLESTSHEILEMAAEHIADDLEELANKPRQSNGRDYYYEFGRSLGVEKQASELKEHISEDCDFI